MTEHTLLCDDVPLAALEQELGRPFVTDPETGMVGVLVPGDGGLGVVEIVVLPDNVWGDEDEEDARVRSFRRSMIFTGSRSHGVSRRCFNVVAKTSPAMLFRDFEVLVAQTDPPVAAE